MKKVISIVVVLVIAVVVGLSMHYSNQAMNEEKKINDHLKLIREEMYEMTEQLVDDSLATYTINYEKWIDHDEFKRIAYESDTANEVDRIIYNQEIIYNIYSKVVNECGIGNTTIKDCSVEGYEYRYSFSNNLNQLNVNIFELGNGKETSMFYHQDDTRVTILSDVGTKDYEIESGSLLKYTIGESFEYYRIIDTEVVRFMSYNVDGYIDFEYMDSTSTNSRFFRYFDDDYDMRYIFRIYKDETEPVMESITFYDSSGNEELQVTYEDGVIDKFEYMFDSIGVYDTYYNTICFIDGLENDTETYETLCDHINRKEDVTLKMSDFEGYTVEEVLTLSMYSLSYDDYSIEDIEGYESKLLEQLDRFTSFNGETYRNGNQFMIAVTH